MILSIMSSKELQHMKKTIPIYHSEWMQDICPTRIEKSGVATTSFSPRYLGFFREEKVTS